MSGDMIFSAEQAETLAKAILTATAPDCVYQVKIQFLDGRVSIVPHCKAIEVTLRGE